MLEWYSYLFAGLAAIAAGFINALAGGGTLITFPVLVALGIPAVDANITNTVALCPGYLGGTYAQRKDLQGHRKRLWIFIPVSIIGGIAGGLLLLYTREQVFRAIVPYLILLAAGLLAIQGPLRKWLTKKSAGTIPHDAQDLWAVILILPATVYGGYFGAGVSVIVLAVLGLILTDTLTRLNALKQLISFSINISAAIFFLFSGKVNWPVALVMVVASLAGGMIGGRMAHSIKPEILRWLVVIIGLTVAAIYLLR